MDKISKITLPNGQTYELKDANVGISSTYDSNTKTVIIGAGSLEDADNMEF